MNDRGITTDLRPPAHLDAVSADDFVLCDGVWYFVGTEPPTARAVEAERAIALCAMLRELAAVAIAQAREELRAAEDAAEAAHDRLEAARATLLEWVERGEAACKLTGEAEAAR